ncbi:Gfo/Idh/MocA family protein [Paenibacillus protaetiae]|uniref:Gfo/Idh/MocA family oxidoreductase n=1 Tax=Paenibacillus protaetiae TaxID=2509456 RepID=A0A4P6EW46_9BACL|nr:Gfo/Idh/MocA family oxidoreductase [Paenibacillus protaetiae]QAY66805.1 Gfo/Idh/MocA family oxidoreductase [Paenibacillus protaetiae]
MEKIKIGIIGTGNISTVYLKNGSSFEAAEVVACADLDVERAKAKGEEFGIRGCSVEEMLADPAIDMVINLTIPQAHAAVCLQALEAGKHVYVEKPFSVTLEDGRKVMELAAKKGLLVGSAPDTFLGGGLQTAIKVIEDGWIGTPIGATAFMMSGGHESWHPSPEFYYQHGGGPMFDMGPYYITALVAMLGPIARVTGSTRISYPERTITSKPKAGQKIEVEVPTHVAGVLEFANGPIGTIVTSFDVKGGSQLPWIEVYGSQGSMMVPDPNNFGGTVKVRRAGSQEWSDIPLAFPNTENGRGMGAADMAKAIQTGRKHRASGELGYHVLEAMVGIHVAAEKGEHYKMTSSCERPASLPLGLAPFGLD